MLQSCFFHHVYVRVPVSGTRVQINTRKRAPEISYPSINALEHTYFVTEFLNIYIFFKVVNEDSVTAC